MSTVRYITNAEKIDAFAIAPLEVWLFAGVALCFGHEDLDGSGRAARSAARW